MSSRAPLIAPEQYPTVTIDTTETSLALQARSVSKAISINYYISCLVSIVAFCFIVGVLVLSTLLSADKKFYLGGILLVCLLALQVVLCASKQEPVALLLISSLTSSLSLLAIGITVGLAFSNVL